MAVKDRAKSDNYQVVVHVDAAALQDKGGKSDLPVESVRRIACDADLVAVTRDAKGNLLNLGRKHRVVSPQLKRALLARDKCCTYPSCSHEQFLEAASRDALGRWWRDQPGQYQVNM